MIGAIVTGIGLRSCVRGAGDTETSPIEMSARQPMLQYNGVNISLMEYDRSTHLEHQKEVVTYLNSNLTLEAKQFYASLLSMPTIGIGHNESYILGDADGDVARMCLLAVHSGNIRLNEKALSSLVKLMDITAKTIKVIHCNIDNMPTALRRLQCNRDAVLWLDTLMLESCYLQSVPQKLIFLGDIVHDRFSINKQATMHLIKVLHANGAIFIKGNHDLIDGVTWTLPTSLPSVEQVKKYDYCKSQYGMFAANSGFEYLLQRSEWQKFEQECFQNCYYDATAKLFYIHHGISYWRSSFFLTGHGRVVDSMRKLKTIEDLAVAINHLEVNHSDLDQSELNTNFRPDVNSDSGTNDSASRHILFKGVTIIHGHCGVQNDLGESSTIPRVINLNPRTASGRLSVAACVVRS